MGVWHQNVTLPCRIEPPTSAVLMHVCWYRETPDQPVYLYRTGLDDVAVQDEAFRGRTQLFRTELGNGNVSLRLGLLRPSDSGVYHCLVQGRGWMEQSNVTLLIPGENNCFATA